MPTTTKVYRSSSREPQERFTCRISSDHCDLEQSGPTEAAAKANARAYAERLALYEPTTVIYGDGTIAQTYTGPDRFGVRYTHAPVPAVTFFHGSSYGYETQALALDEILRLATFHGGVKTAILASVAASREWDRARAAGASR